MPSSVNFSLMAGFKAVTAWQQNIIRNAQGLITPGYNRENLHLGGAPGGASGSQIGTQTSGSRSGMAGAGDTLTVGGRSFSFGDGTLEDAASPTALAIKGPGFFLVAENLNPGARLFVTRAGDFRYDAQGRLTTSQGLFVVGGAGTLSDPIQPVFNPGDGSVPLAALTLARVPLPGNLAASGYGNTTYQLTASSGTMQAFANGRPEVGFVQPNKLEYPDRIANQAQLQLETNQAQQTYKLFKDMLDSYNRMVDDAISVVK